MANRKRPTDDVEDAETVEPTAPVSEKDAKDQDVPDLDQGADDTPPPVEAGDDPVLPDDAEEQIAKNIEASEDDAVDGDEPDAAVDDAEEAGEPDAEGEPEEPAVAAPIITPWGGAGADISKRSTTDPNSPEYKAPVSEAPAPVHNDHDDYEEEHSSLASRVLMALFLLIAGGVLFLWGAPKVAPHLPPFMAPVAEWLVPGERAAQAEAAALEARLNARIDEIQTGTSAQEVQTTVDAEVIAAEERMAALVTGLSDRLDAVSDQVAAADSAPIEERLGQVEVQLEGLRAEMSSLRDDLTGVAENAQDADGQVGAAVGANAAEIDGFSAALDGVQAELAALAQQNGNLSQRIDEVAAQAERQIAQARAEVEQAEAEAQAEVLAVSEQADMVSVRNALATGQSFAEELSRLAEQAEVPEALSAVAGDGVATQEELEARFPPLARAAIQEAIAAEGEGSGLFGNASAFVRARVAGRSLVELEGDDVDAVLSRVEARLEEGALDAALAEAEDLPDDAVVALGSWLEDLGNRAAALSGYQTLADRLDAGN